MHTGSDTKYMKRVTACQSLESWWARGVSELVLSGVVSGIRLNALNDGI